jgi:hypothetical protein
MRTPAGTYRNVAVVADAAMKNAAKAMRGRPRFKAKERIALKFSPSEPRVKPCAQGVLAHAGAVECARVSP